MKQNWERVLSEEFASKVPEGYETTCEIAQKTNLTHRQTYDRLTLLLKQGKVTRIKCNKNGSIGWAWKVNLNH